MAKYEITIAWDDEDLVNEDFEEEALMDLLYDEIKVTTTALTGIPGHGLRLEATKKETP